jgi:recombination protein RecR
MIASSPIEDLISSFSRLPGLGPRSARRVTLKLIRERTRLLEPLYRQIGTVLQQVTVCSECGNIDTANPCHLCADPRRDDSLICIVEDVADLWALERSRMYHGRYHVLNGTLSALDNRGPEQLSIPRLLARAAEEGVQEVVIATNNTVEGQTTAHYLTEALHGCNVKITRLAQGIPMGGELDYIDEGTLAAAFSSRLAF